MMTKTINEDPTSSGSSSENENIEQDDEESVASAEETNEDIALDVSDTSSSENDDDDEEEDDNDANSDDEEDKIPVGEDRIRNEITERYEKSKGMKLYVRFPAKLPANDEELEKQAKALSTLITRVHRPRQKHARFCLVDFASKEDRDTALQAINKAKKDSQDNDLKRTIVNIPRTESDEFVENLVKQKLKTMESKKAKRRLKKAGIVANRADKFTSTLIITNLPKRTSILEIRTAFPNAVDVQLKNTKAAVTLPSTFDARTAYKKPPTISGILLKLRFDKIHIKKSNNKKKKITEIKNENGQNEVEIEEEEIEKPETSDKKKPMVKTQNKKRTASIENSGDNDQDANADMSSTTVAKKRQKQNNNPNKKIKKQI